MKVSVKPGFLLLLMCALAVIGAKCTAYALAAAIFHEAGHFAAV